MGQQAAKEGDHITGNDEHWVTSTSSSSPIKGSFPFDGLIDGGLSQNVYIMKKRAAVVDSTARNISPHKETDDIKLPKDAKFIGSPSNEATITTGSSSVRINGKAAARNSDTASTCNTNKFGVSEGLANGNVIASSTVIIG